MPHRLGNFEAARKDQTLYTTIFSYLNKYGTDLARREAVNLDVVDRKVAVGFVARSAFLSPDFFR